MRNRESVDEEVPGLLIPTVDEGEPVSALVLHPARLLPVLVIPGVDLIGEHPDRRDPCRQDGHHTGIAHHPFPGLHRGLESRIHEVSDESKLMRHPALHIEVEGGITRSKSRLSVCRSKQLGSPPCRVAGRSLRYSPQQVVEFGHLAGDKHRGLLSGPFLHEGLDVGLVLHLGGTGPTAWEAPRIEHLLELFGGAGRVAHRVLDGRKEVVAEGERRIHHRHRASEIAARECLNRSVSTVAGHVGEKEVEIEPGLQRRGYPHPLLPELQEPRQFRVVIRPEVAGEDRIVEIDKHPLPVIEEREMVRSSGFENRSVARRSDDLWCPDGDTRKGVPGLLRETDELCY